MNMGGESYKMTTLNVSYWPPDPLGAVSVQVALSPCSALWSVSKEHVTHGMTAWPQVSGRLRFIGMIRHSP